MEKDILEYGSYLNNNAYLYETECPADYSKNDSKTVSEMPEAAAAIVGALGIQPCKQGSVAVGGASVIPPAILAGGASFNIGCEQIQVIASKVQTLQEVMTCIMTKISATSKVVIIQANNVELNFAGVNTGKITITQDIGVTVRVVQELNMVDKADIKEQLISFVDIFSKALQDSKTQLVSNPQAQRNIQSLAESLTQKESLTKINNTIDDFTFSGVSKNNVKLTFTGLDGMTCRAGDIVINQTTMMNYQAHQIVTAVLNTIFSTEEGIKVKEDIQAEQKSSAEGLAKIFGAVSTWLIIAGIFLIGGFIIFGGGSVAMVLKYIIPIAIIAFIVLAVYFGIKKEYLIMGLSLLGGGIMGVMEFFTTKKSHSAVEL